MALYQKHFIPCTLDGLPLKKQVSITSFSNRFSLKCKSWPVQCKLAAESQAIVRRSANYQPTIWDYSYIQSLTSEYQGEAYNRGATDLKEEVGMILEKSEGVAQLELIDNLQRLGLSYHFEDEIKIILSTIYDTRKRPLSQFNAMINDADLHATALEFRLLRQQGYNVLPDVFNGFIDVNGKFKCSLCDDTEGILSLYEASHLLVEGENILEDARLFATKHLQEYAKQSSDNNAYLSSLVNHALELPLDWKIERAEARWFIDIYEKKIGMNPVFLQLAKLDFNLVQAKHQEDLKQASTWWVNTGLGKKLPFARDRLMENFLWTVAVVPDPRFQHCRRAYTKLNTIITTIDDVYDIYGTLEELELFTDAVERWDLNAMEQMPDYMKTCFLALYNFVNEMSFDALNKHGVYVIRLLRKAWADLCKSYLVEARWYYGKHTPPLQEYMDNGWVSIAVPVVLVHAYFWVSDEVTLEALQCLNQYPQIIQWSSMIMRLANDLGTSPDELKRGDISKSMQCYMNEKGASEEEARQHILHLISEAWEKVNRDRMADRSPFSKLFETTSINLARMALCTYQDGDGFGSPDQETKDIILSLLVQPIPLK
ncbi:terpene synthase 10-like [Rutidosis leptorrhynchoides]|uniref:terpene synthase 10-like n=1 Tax=Rutidosis leptorrhynchoides TaxID=125765 RepID=UPI003A9997E9